MFGRLLILSVVLATTSCDLLNFGCETILRPGIRVTVLDPISGQQLAMNEVTVVAIEGVHADTSQVGVSSGTFYFLYERAGTFRVEVMAPGYSTWVQEDVRVEAPDPCSRTVELVARMQLLS